MSKRALRSLKRWTTLQAPPAIAPSRPFHNSVPPRYSAAVTVTVPDSVQEVHAPAKLDAVDFIKKQRLDDLNASLTSDDINPNRVWGNYISLLSLLGFDTLPLEIHQQVLRRCTPPTPQLRLTASRKLWSGSTPRAPHLYEARFQAVIRNIRAAGAHPALDDFHFVLEQFAAVGHHLGARGVLDEVRTLGLAPRAKTYGLVLQALAHRLTLPVLPSQRERLRRDAGRMCVGVLNEMWAAGIPFVSACLDLALRILRETADADGFDRLMKVVYGFDLAYSDSAPLELHAPGRLVADGDIMNSVSSPLPFSTAALNTTIDTLGRTGRLSKMVEAFEVLTAPLPTPSVGDASSSAFEDDDDFGFGETPEPPPRPFRAPNAEPNTTTYSMLIKWVCKAGHAPFARHYAWQAMQADFAADRRLRSDAHNDRPLAEVVAPRVSVNRGTFLPVFGLANHQKDVEAMRWVLKMCNRALKRKAHHTAYYNAWAERLLERGERLDAFSAVTADSPSLEALSTAPASVAPARSGPSQTKANGLDAGDVDLSAFSIDVNTADRESAAVRAASLVHTPPKPKPFDLVRHLELLQRDLSELSQFTKHVEDVLGRTVQRTKERLGRRVWQGRDIWLRDTGPERNTVEREHWRAITGWQQRGMAGKHTWRDLWYRNEEIPSIQGEARRRFREKKAAIRMERAVDGEVVKDVPSRLPEPLSS